MLKVICVLRSGGDYDPRYVVALGRGVRRHLQGPFEFVCMTDQPEDVSAVCKDAGIECSVRILQYDWPGWFAKIEVLEEPGPSLYLDLDTVIVGDISPLADAVESLGTEDLIGLSDLYRPKIWQTGIMGWTSPLKGAVERFIARSNNCSWKFRSGRVYLQTRTYDRYDGDAEWIRPDAEEEGRYLLRAQSFLPGIVSYKSDVLGLIGKLPPAMTIVCFHGRPRPHELNPIPGWMSTSGWNSRCKQEARREGREE